MLTKTCAECGSEFQVDDGKRNWQSIKYCSKECQRVVNLKRVKERYEPVQYPQARQCRWCGKGFLVEGPGGKPRQYCSRKCYLEKAQNQKMVEREANREKKVCPTCGTAFFPHPSNVKRQVFCSTKCYYAKSRKAHEWKHRPPVSATVEFNYMRPLIKKRDNGVCTLCGKSDRPQIHHWDGSGRKINADNQESNLATLCHDCHHSIHRVTVVKVSGQWMVSGAIFDILGVTGPLYVHKADDS